MNSTAVARPLPGPGLVARAGDLLLVCDDAGAGVEDLLRLVSEVAAGGGDGGVLVRRVAAILAADFDGRYPACAVSGPAADGRLAVLVYGAATADIVGGDGEISLSGAEAITSVNRLVAGPVTAIRLQVPGAGAADPRSRFDGGVITAAGIVYADPGAATPTPSSMAAPSMSPSSMSPSSMAPPSMVEHQPPAVAPPPQPVALPSQPAALPPLSVAPAPEPVMAAPLPVAEPPVMTAPAPPVLPVPAPPEPPALPVPASPEPPALPVSAPPVPAPEPAPMEPKATAPVVDREPPSLRQPDPSAPFVAVLLVGEGANEPVEPPAPAADMRPRVLGVLCKNNHFNDPNLRYCSVCGISMAQQTLVKHEGPRPPLGVLLLDDGSTFRLDVDYVIGREPHQDPEVAAGTVRPLRVADAEGVVSRRHARVALVGWDVQVADLGSANGTFVQAPGDPQRRPLVPNQPVVVQPGTQVTIGRRWFRYESHRNP